MARLIRILIKSEKINLKSNQLFAVAILGDGDFDVLDLDELMLGPNGAKPVASPQLEDSDGDGHTDLVVNFHAKDSGLSIEDVVLCLSGNTTGGLPIGVRQRFSNLDQCDRVR